MNPLEAMATLRESFALAWPWALALLPLPWLMRCWPRRAGTGAALRVPYPAQVLAEVVASQSPSHWRRWLLWLGWGLLCVALARPQRLDAPQAPPLQARQMMLAVDLSGSMSEPDMELGGRVVDRLTAAKAVLADFLERRRGDRVGLLVFGQRAFVLTPLTADLTTVREQLRDSVVGLAGRETAIGDAIVLAVKRLRAQASGQRVLIVLTDGVNTAGLIEPLRAAELAAGERVRVHTIAFGSDGLRTLFGIALPGDNDDPVDEKTLRAVASRTGGRFFRARDSEQLSGIYAELDQLEPVASSAPALRPRREDYPWPLALAMLVAMAAWLIPARWR